MMHLIYKLLNRCETLLFDGRFSLFIFILPANDLIQGLFRKYNRRLLAMSGGMEVALNRRTQQASLYVEPWHWQSPY